MSQDRIIIFDYFSYRWNKELGFHGEKSVSKKLSEMTKKEIIQVINNRHKNIAQSHENSVFQKFYNDDIRLLTERLKELKSE